MYSFDFSPSNRFFTSSLQFEATKEKITIVNSAEVTAQPILGSSVYAEVPENMETLSKGLSIPRRPHWNRMMTADEIDRSEGLAFLDWRRNLARHEEESMSKLTPFEKNLDIWRQLWRVVESSFVLLIVCSFFVPFLS